MVKKNELMSSVIRSSCIKNRIRSLEL